MLNISRVKVSPSACGVFVYYFNIRPKYVFRLSLLLLLLLCVIHCDVTQFYLNRHLKTTLCKFLSERECFYICEMFYPFINITESKHELLTHWTDQVWVS